MPSPPPAVRRTTALRAAALIALGIGVATLWPMPGAAQPWEVNCIICGPLGGIDFLSNIVFFVPLGVALRLGGVPMGRGIAAGAALSLAVEALQWRLVAGRDASFGDVLANTIGSGVGALLVDWLVFLVRPSRRSATALGVGWTAVLVLAGGVGAWGLRPAPVDFVYWSQWAPIRDGYVPFRGRLAQLTLFGRKLPNGTVVNPATEDRRYASGAMDVSARIVPAPFTPGTTLIARAANPLGEQFELAQRGHDLWFRARRNASRLRLRSPSAVLPAAFRDPSPGEYDLEAVVRTDGITLSVRDPSGREVTREVAFTLGMAWQTVTPFEVKSPAAVRPLALVLFALAFVPLTMWAASAAGRRAAIGWAIAVGVVLMVGLPAVFGIAAGGVWEAAGAAAGAAIGTWLARVSVATTSEPAGRRSP